MLHRSQRRTGGSCGGKSNGLDLYPATGQVSARDNDGHVSSYSYDSLGRITETVVQSGSTSHTTRQGWDVNDKSKGQDGFGLQCVCCQYVEKCSLDI